MSFFQRTIHVKDLGTTSTSNDSETSTSYFSVSLKCELRCQWFFFSTFRNPHLSTSDSDLLHQWGGTTSIVRSVSWIECVKRLGIVDLSLSCGCSWWIDQCPISHLFNGLSHWRFKPTQDVNELSKILLTASCPCFQI